MRQPEMYINETTSVIGRVLDHNDGINEPFLYGSILISVEIGDADLGNYTAATQQLWQQEYNQDYFSSANPRPRGIQPQVYQTPMPPPMQAMPAMPPPIQAMPTQLRTMPQQPLPQPVRAAPPPTRSSSFLSIFFVVSMLVGFD